MQVDDILVGNAGVPRRTYSMDLTEEGRDRAHRVSAKGVFFCLQRVARWWRSRVRAPPRTGARP